MIVMTGGLGLVAERVLIDAHVVMVSEVLFDDIVQIDAGGRPLVGAVIFVGGRGSNHGRQYNGDKDRGDEPFEVRPAHHLGLS